MQQFDSFVNNQLEEHLRYRGTEADRTHFHLCSYTPDLISVTKSESWNELLPALDAGKIHWLQIHGLSQVNAVKEICQYFGVDFLLAQDILNPDHPVKIEVHEKYILVIMKLIVTDENENALSFCQVSFVQGQNFILTFSDRDTDIFDEVLCALKKNLSRMRCRATDFLLSVLLNSVINGYASLLSAMEDKLEDLEEKMLECMGTDRITIGEIQGYRSHCRLIKKNIAPLKEQLPVLLRSDHALIGKSSFPFFRDVNDHLQSALQTLDSCREMISALVDLYLSNNDLRMNNIMKQLTVVSSLFIPLTFFAGIWGMNFKNMPELEWDYGYAMAWAVMVLIALIVFFIFKKRKWY